MSEWQPIETRPEEGEFLAYDPISKKQDVCYATTRRGRTWSKKSCEAVQSDGEYGPDEDEFAGGRASHWMPLPPAPETK